MNIWSLEANKLSTIDKLSMMIMANSEALLGGE